MTPPSTSTRGIITKGFAIKEPFNGLSHLLGAVLSALALVYLIFLALEKGTVTHLVSFIIFGATLVLLYSASAFYHLHTMSGRADLLLKRVDHLMIFFLIAGSYTPFCLLPLKGPTGIRLLVAVWGLAAAGIFVSVYWIHRPRWVGTGIYLGMGWMAVTAIFPLQRALSGPAFAWLLMGGFAYSFGAIIYGTKWPNPWPKNFGFHEIWHLFVLAGSACHFLSVINLI